MKKFISQLSLFVAVAFGAATAFAGGPLELAGSSGRTPVTYPNGGQNITMHLDQGTLGSRSKAQADAIFNQAFSLWNNVATSTVALNRGADLPVDVTAANYNTYLSKYSDGLNPVIYDTDGSITDSLFGVGAKNNILGFAGSAYFTSTASYAEGEAVINGFISISDNTLAVVLTHEIGHFIGLDHTQLDNTQGLASANYALMYPIAFRSLASLHEDDTSAISALYPTGISAAYGTLTGVFTQANAAAILGANIWVRETATGKVYSCVSDFLKESTGFYRMLLPPGTYTLNAESIQTNFTGGSSVGPYANSSSSASFLAPHPITPVAFQGSTPGQTNTFKITAGCAANITFKLDGSGAVVSTTCLNSAPIAQNGSISTPSNTPANGIAAVTDADNDPLAYRIVSQGTRGTASMNVATGAYTYTPLGTSSGSDSFTFAANDGTVDSNIATISVTITNIAPVVGTVTATPLTLLDNATSQLQATASDSDGPLASSYQWTILSGGGSVNNAAIANPIYTPANVSASTPVTINVAVSDGLATTNRSITLTVNDAGLPLVVSTVSLVGGTVGIAYSQTLAATGGKTPYTWSVVSGNLPTGLSLSAATGVVSGTPNASGTSNFTVRVTDANNATVDRALVLTVASAPPALLSLTISTDNANEVYLNGVLLGTANDWTKSSNYSAALQSGTNVLAVKGIDAGGVAGLIAELTLPSGAVVSDTTWKVSSTAPAGWEILGFNDSAWPTATSYGQYGVGPWFKNITGFPSNSSASWIWTADSNNDNTAYFRYTFTVGSAPLAISTATLANGVLGTAYTQTLAATGGKPPYTWSVVSGNLLTGLSLNASTGVISGTPTVAGTSNFTVRVTDANNATADRALALTVASAPPALLSLTISTDNANEVYLNGVLLGTANDWTKSSNYSAALQSGTNVLAVKGIDAGGVAGLIAELTLPSGTVVSDTTWKVSATAPTGWETLGFNDGAWPTATGYGPYGVGPWFKNITGFPSNSSANWIWTADSNNDNTAYFRYTFTVGSAPLAISTATLANGVLGTAYTQTLAATGGKPPYTWSVVSGNLLTGLSLNASTGVISGTPTVAGTSNFTVRVTDANNATADRALALTVASAPPALLSLTISTDNANEIYLNGVLLGTANDWTKSKNYSAALQSGTNVLAVKGIDAGGVAALIAELSLPSGTVVSDTTWKVSSTAPAGWETLGFNDSAWPTATSYGQYGVGPWFKNITGFPSNSSANWIWTADSNNDNTAYFRYTFTVP